jgi:prepilin-type processing-associated H-X9-DG protein
MVSGRLCAVVLLCIARVASAQTADPWTAPTTPDESGEEAPATHGDGVKLGGFFEAYEDWNFREPSNGVNNLRGFDLRYATFAIQNAVVDVTWTKGPVTGRIALQFGDEPDAYYQAEPTQPASGTAPASGPTEWRHIQEAWASWTPCGKLELTAGLVGSPIGPEVIALKDDWNWSHSNLYFMLPYFHAGVRAKHPIGDTGLYLIGAVYNGWNNALDENRSPSFDAIVQYQKGDWTAQAQYFTGVQRPDGGPDTQHWRHVFDAYVQGPIVDKLAFILQGNGGFERSAPGVADRPQWLGGAAYLKYDITSRVYVAARGDVLREWRPAGATPIFLPSGVDWITSGTATVAWRPVPGLDLRLEYRHDAASNVAFFDGTVLNDPDTGFAIANTEVQDTVTGGVIAWF